jgi:hypothetical protein
MSIDLASTYHVANGADQGRWRAATATGPLRGRQRERAALGQLLSDVRSGRSRVLVLRGEPGIGKTALLDDLCAGAGDVTLVRGAGAESEAEIAFAGLHQMCAQMIQEKLDLLPDPQREAIRVAFGESCGGPPNPFLLGLAVLNRLADAAQERPVLCVVDDAQWLDRATARALAFVARRLDAEAVGIVFAVREPMEQFAGLPELVVSGLAPEDARDLLGTAPDAPVDQALRERFIAETGGNPLALLELSAGLAAAEGQDESGRHDSRGLWVRLEESFQRRVEGLSAGARMLLLIAAAEPVGDPVLLWRAADLLGVPWEAAALLEESGLLQVGATVEFRHPLVRSAVYRQSALGVRRSVPAWPAPAQPGPARPGPRPHPAVPRRTVAARRSRHPPRRPRVGAPPRRAARCAARPACSHTAPAGLADAGTPDRNPSRPRCRPPPPPAGPPPVPTPACAAPRPGR